MKPPWAEVALRLTWGMVLARRNQDARDDINDAVHDRRRCVVGLLEGAQRRHTVLRFFTLVLKAPPPRY